VRTFEANGKTVAEFSDMYGMNAVEVASVVERVGRSGAFQPRVGLRGKRYCIGCTSACRPT
jgi:hypothetical protein